MKQLFEISWNEERVTSELICGLIRQYFDCLPVLGTITVTGITTEQNNSLNEVDAKEIPREET